MLYWEPKKVAVITLYNVCSVHRGPFSKLGDTMSTLGEYHEYIGRCSVHWGDIMMHVGDIMSTSGDVQYTGGYHDTYGEQVGENLSVSIENPNVLMISPMYS